MIAALAGLAVAAPVDVAWPEVHGKGRSGYDRQLGQLVLAEVDRAVQDAGHTPTPFPEGVEDCPDAGCEHVRVTSVLVRDGQGCVVLAAVGPPGRSPSLIVPWVGRVTLASVSVPFGQPTAPGVTVLDFAPCEELPSRLRAGRAAVGTLVGSLVGAP